MTIEAFASSSVILANGYVVSLPILVPSMRTRAVAAKLPHTQNACSPNSEGKGVLVGIQITRYSHQLAC